MTAAILAILAALVPLVIVLIRRRIAKADDPKIQTEKRIEVLHKEIANDDEKASRLRIGRLLDRARLRHSQGHSKRPGTPQG